MQEYICALRSYMSKDYKKMYRNMLVLNMIDWYEGKEYIEEF